MPSGPYLPTSAAYLKESALLLQAYPDSTRITTKYTFPKTSSKPSKSSKSQSKPDSQPQDPSSTTPAQPLASLVLKTYTPEAGICLKYTTNKAAEVGRLINALGLLAGRSDMGLLDGAAAVVAVGGDVEMGGVGGGGGGEEVGTATASAAAAAAAATGANAGAGGGANTGSGVGKGKGKGKKKGKK